MRPDRTLLQDVIDAANALERFTSGKSEAEFHEDEMLQSAVVFQLIIIGEAVNRLSPELKQQHPAVPWRPAIDQRNVIAHGYFALDWQVVWTTVTNDIPAFRQQIQSIIELDAHLT
jgi:uncharacterized protein with HEPN domain